MAKQIPESTVCLLQWRTSAFPFLPLVWDSADICTAHGMSCRRRGLVELLQQGLSLFKLIWAEANSSLPAVPLGQSPRTSSCSPPALVGPGLGASVAGCGAGLRVFVAAGLGKCYLFSK